MNETKRNSILIVDDEPSNIMALSHILSPQYAIYAEKEGRAALETAAEILPDVILLDIVMPEMDGYEVFTRLKASEKTKDIPVIFVTGLREAADEEKGLSMGASDYIIKPFFPAIVKLRVMNQIKITEHIRQNIEKERSDKNSIARTDFLTRISHQMLTPMNTVMGLTEVLKIQMNKAGNVSDKAKKCFDDIDSASRYLLELIQDLLDISGKGEGSFTLASAAFTVDTLFKTAVKGVSRDAAKKRLAIAYDIDPSVPPELIGDEERLGQVIMNLLTNAVKFTPEYGAVSLCCKRIDEDGETVTLQIEVSDNGKGIPKEQQGRIFSLFEQEDGSMTIKHAGIGLGLPISRRIVEMMGGQIWVESETGKGSKFIFTCKARKM